MLAGSTGQLAKPTITPPGSATTPQASAPTPTGLAQSARLVRIYDVEPSLLAAGDGRLYGVVVPESGSGAVVVRLDSDGTIERHALADPLAPYYSHFTDQGSWLYLSTSVIKRFASAPDELLRIDPSTLTVRARTTLPGGVDGGLVSDAGSIWAALADRILRLDPTSLAVRASHVIPGLNPVSGGPYSTTSLALGEGGLWATVGGALSTTVYRFDPVTLTVRDQMTVPASGLIVADSESVWFTGLNSVWRIDPAGGLSEPTATPLNPSGSNAAPPGLRRREAPGDASGNQRIRCSAGARR
jgi:hypothetical protein